MAKTNQKGESASNRNNELLYHLLLTGRVYLLLDQGHYHLLQRGKQLFVQINFYKCLQCRIEMCFVKCICHAFCQLKLILFCSCHALYAALWIVVTLVCNRHEFLMA